MLQHTWAFSGRVESGKEIDEKRDRAKTTRTFTRDQEAETGCEQSPCHIRECEEQQGAATEGIDSPDRWPCKDEVDETEAE